MLEPPVQGMGGEAARAEVDGSARACLTCGGNLDGYAPGVRHCSAECATTRRASRSGVQAASPAERGYDHVWRKVRLEVLDRDEWTCQIGTNCEQRPWALLEEPATVDHVVELDLGDPMGDPRRLDPDNLVAACKPCNSAKAARNTNAKRRATHAHDQDS